MIGSRARTDHPADAWSDLDVLVFAHHPEQFIEDAGWAAEIAPFWLTFVERTGDGSTWERRTLYTDGLDVDIALSPAEGLDGLLKNGKDHPLPADISDMIRRGVKILVDKDGKLAQILQLPLYPSRLNPKPTEAEFINAVSDFWYHTLWGVKHLRRGELWWGKSCVDMYLKGHLQRMLEWHARALQGEQIDTWLRGRFLEEWADPRALEQLGDCFAHYDARDVARALRGTMRLYRWLEDETARAWGYQPPVAGENQAAEMARLLLEDAE
jgi:aminoglycoside 6-adenylyltransferase